jgi:hypothetical protein
MVRADKVTGRPTAIELVARPTLPAAVVLGTDKGEIRAFETP